METALAGMYRCLACRTELFGSTALIGPEDHHLSFSAPVERDRLAITLRTEEADVVRCRSCGARLGERINVRGKPRYRIDTVTLTFTPSV